MLTEPTIVKLIDMHLPKMAELFQDIMEHPEKYQEISFADRVGMMIDSEWNRRHSAALIRRLKSAEFAIPEACVENIRFDSQRQLDKTQIVKLSTCDFIQNHRNVIVLGATGTGKTYISCALGVAATRKLFTAKYKRLPQLLLELDEAKIQGNYQKILRKYQNVDLLIIDEWMISSVSPENALDLLEIMEERYNKKSTILCSQYEVAGWFGKISEPTIADAIFDRVVNNSHKIVLSGDSMRKIMGENGD